MSKIILDLCGGSGAWSQPYKDNGYDVRLITWPTDDVRTYQPPADVYGVLAAPPCTQFSLTRTTPKIPRDMDKGFEIVHACLKIIRQTKPHFWALENPLGLLRHFLGRPRYTFDPYEFGDSYTKKTDLWGYFTEPKKAPVLITSSRMKKIRAIRDLHLQEKYGNNYNKETRQDLRAITPRGFAQAFYEANK